jgi:hypothetical protein
MYDPFGDDPKLVGVMYFAEDMDSKIRYDDNPLIKPHIHVWEKPFCYVEDVIRYESNCMKPDENMYWSSPEMFHVWFVDNKTGGPFATSMSLYKERATNAPSKLSKQGFIEALERSWEVDSFPYES